MATRSDDPAHRLLLVRRIEGTFAAHFAEIMAYIHEQPDWPHFTWNVARLSPLLAKIRRRQGRLLGRMEGLGFRLQAEASLGN